LGYANRGVFNSPGGGMSNETAYVEDISAQAWDIHTPPDVLANIANDAKSMHWLIRRGLAQNPNTPAEVLIKLATEACAEDIRFYVEHHRNTPDLVKLWLKNPDFAGLTLVEFLEIAKSP
jgi:hypothetical protein